MHSERRMISGRSASRSRLSSRSAKSSASRVAAILMASASPAWSCRGLRVRRVSGSMSTFLGWKKEPTTFFTPWKFTAVLPPMEESTWESRVVGML